jgi:hypothetical protein
MKNYLIQKVIMLPITLFLFLFLFNTSAIAGTFSSAATGNWNSSSSWTLTSGSDGDGIPDANDDVTIVAGHTITVNDDVSSASLTVNGTLSYNDNDDRTITVTGNLSITSGGTFTTANAIGENNHSLNLAGNLTNNGTFDCINGNDDINIIFNGSSNQAVSGTGATMDFNDIAINNSGAVNNNIVDITSTNFTIPSAFLTLTDGVFKLSMGATITFTENLSLGSDVGFIVNHTSAVVNIPDDDVLVRGGDFQLLGGTLSLGNGNDRFNVNGGTAVLSGGTLNINGRFDMTGGTTTINGSAINIDPQESSTLGNNSHIFEATGASSIIFTSGTVIVVDPHNGTGSGNAVQIVSGAGAKNFAGSTIQLGNGTSTTSGSTEGFDVNGGSSITLGSLVINNPSGTNRHTSLVTNDCELAGNLTITAGTFQSNNQDVALAGNWTNNGTFTSDTGTITYNGTIVQTIGGSSSTTFNNVIIDNSAGATLSANQTINGTLTFTNGNFNTGSNNIAFGTTGSVNGESSGKYLVGNLTTSRNVGTSSNNFGGIGVNFDAGGDDVGTVSVTRVSGSAGTVSANGNEGIDRRWVITSTSPPSSGRTISFSWVSNDDNGVVLTEAWAFKSSDNGLTWNPDGLVQDVSSSRTITIVTNSFSIWTVADESGPLPVELSSFTATVKGNDVNLNWETKTEVQNYGFEIERCQMANGKSQTEWSNIGFVKGNGNSNSPKEYSFVDNKLTFGIYYYRLKQIDTDGGFEYSIVVEVDFSVADNFSLEQNYPNPFNPSTNITYALQEDAKVQIKVYDMLGSEVAELVNETKPAGFYETTFDASDLSSGVYIYRITVLSGDKILFSQSKQMILIK